MKNTNSIIGAVALCLSLAGSSALAAGNVNDPLGMAINQVNNSLGVIKTMQQNIKREFETTHRISRGHPNLSKSLFIARAYNDTNGVITINFRSQSISGALKNVVLKLTPMYNGQPLSPSTDTNIDGWECTYKTPANIKNRRFLNVTHNTFIYADTPLNACVEAKPDVEPTVS